MILFLFNKLHGIKEASFDVRQEEVLLFLAGCSALKNDRDEITIEDVLNGYKTLFKIIKTDLTKIICEKPENEHKTGFLVCSGCNNYYQLQPGESPADFSDTCECGGKLKFKANIGNEK